MVSQQQYRQHQFKTYLELIFILLIVKQTNELLLKNHDLRPTGSKALLEANANSSKSIGRFKDREHEQGHNLCRGGRRLNRPRQSNLGPNHGKGKKPVKKHNESICHRCGMVGHWSHTCRTPKHVADLYQAPLKDKGKRVETHAIENSTTMTNVEANNASIKMTSLAHVEARTSLEVSDFFEDPDSQDKVLE
ncbi:PREDICTED: uncharacterized protein LOC108663251 [Theobroma cacao]|uniref:Uncharacterized protein LOC108663251 n=1 Tax=Theobroma cacao TaxID=3641 RepID=A0AB32WX83_THECC|nr:PREDICTED: uncharacterized protein LOC108663251 [Theobroma cacao]